MELARKLVVDPPDTLQIHLSVCRSIWLELKSFKMSFLLLKGLHTNTL